MKFSDEGYKIKKYICQKREYIDAEFIGELNEPAPPKGQLNSEWFYEVIISSKTQP